ncbi:MAG TPA: RNA polymerase sigma factor [Acidobacteriaceae bacterium]|nr:RNA polymerase sigma factor [Acidobacteriaceae bacterium]HTX42365.1 RNA polymerase sigma factor [Acidobacteriaceae bacterium]
MRAGAPRRSTRGCLAFRVCSPADARCRGLAKRGKSSASSPPLACVYVYRRKEQGTSLSAHDHSFRSLMLEHQSMVFSIALRILGDRFQAEEVAQDVFLELHAKREELTSGEHILHWLRRVAVHRSIDRIRQRERRQEIAMDSAELPEVAFEAPPGDPLLSRQLRQLVASLPAAPRAVIVLRYQEDLTPEEIAATMKMPVATVKSHLRRTLRLLREKMTRVLR